MMRSTDTETKEAAASNPAPSVWSSLSGFFYRPTQTATIAPPNPFVTKLQQADLTQRLEICRELFSDNTKLVTEGAVFQTYGKNEYTFPTLAYYLGLKSNQKFNEKAAEIMPTVLREVPTVEAVEEEEKFKPIPAHVPEVFQSLCELRKIRADIIASKGPGTTTQKIEGILLHYQIPLKEQEYEQMCKLVNEVLEDTITITVGSEEREATCLDFYNLLSGVLPVQTISMTKAPASTPIPR